MIIVKLKPETMTKNYATKYISKIITVSIDRPMGSKHPKWCFIYPLSYGKIPVKNF